MAFSAAQMSLLRHTYSLGPKTGASAHIANASRRTGYFPAMGMCSPEHEDAKPNWKTLTKNSEGCLWLSWAVQLPTLTMNP